MKMGEREEAKGGGDSGIIVFKGRWLRKIRKIWRKKEKKKGVGRPSN